MRRRMLPWWRNAKAINNESWRQLFKAEENYYEEMYSRMDDALGVLHKHVNAFLDYRDRL